MSTRIEWEGGWADLSDSLTHARRMRIVRALDKGQSGSTVDMMEFAIVVAAAHVVAWSVGDVDPVTGPPIEALDALPSEAVDAMRDGALALWTSRADPNAMTTGSGRGRSASQSRAATPTSSTRSG